MGTFEVVVPDPETDTLTGSVKAVELGTGKELLVEGLPEPLDFTQCHGMVRTGFDMVDFLFLELFLKSAGSTPVGVLTAVVREHLFGRVRFSHAAPKQFDDVFRRLAPV